MGARPAKRYAASKDDGRSRSIEDYKEAWERAEARAGALSEQLDAYRIQFWGGIGGGIDCDKYDMVIICRLCHCLASPRDHVCSGR